MLTTPRLAGAAAALLGLAVLPASPLPAADCEGVEPVAGESVTLELVSEDLSQPVEAVAPPGDTERLFVVEQTGAIRIIDLADDGLRAEPFLDLSSEVVCCGERGLLGLAFHPDWPEDDRFFVYSTQRAAPGCQVCNRSCNSESVVASYRLSAGDPNRADPESETVLLSFSQPYGNHNAGKIAFGPLDGYLYIATGDGGSGGDPCNSGQDPLSFLGKILRIDVDSSPGASPYAIPADNPFAERDDALSEIWALGLRNPWRFAFDSANGDLYIADVGQNDWEEVDWQPGDAAGGANYEWRVREGDHDFDTGTDYGPGTRVGPVYEYPHGGGVFRGCSISGGVVYRGCRMPDLHGAYFFADYCNNWVATFRIDGGEVTELTDRTAELNEGIAPDRVDQVVAFGKDGRGEVYICDHDTKLFRVVPASTEDPPPVARVSTEPDPAEVVLEGGRAEVTLDGTASENGEGGTEGLSWFWERVEGPDDFTIADPDAPQTTVELRTEGRWTFSLTVDDGNATDRAEVEVTASLPSSPEFLRADANADGSIDISDGVRILISLFVGGGTLDCADAADANDSGLVDVSDAIFTLNWLFTGGPDPLPPGVSDCGPDPTEDELDCATFAPCAS